MLGGQFICVDVGKLATKVGELINPNASIVGVGNSGGEFACLIEPAAPVIGVETTKFSAIREERRLKVTLPDGLDAVESLTLIDDVAVSGWTIENVRKVLSGVDVVGLGLLYKSRRTRKRIGAPDVEILRALEYYRLGGGTVPINSIDALAKFPERCGELADRYFGDVTEDFRKIIVEMGGKK